MDQLLFNRPVPGYAQYRSPVARRVHVRLEHASGRRRHGRAGRQCRARGSQGSWQGALTMASRAHRPATTASSSAAATMDLVCAATLARGGRSVLVLEARAQVGGAALTREFAPGFQVSACAHLRAPDAGRAACAICDLERARARAGPAQRHADARRWRRDGAPLAARQRIWRGRTHACLSQPTARRCAASRRRWCRCCRGCPPRLGTTDWKDLSALLGLGWQIRKLGRRDMRELLRIGGMNVHDLLEEHFESAAAQGRARLRRGARHEFRSALAGHRVDAAVSPGGRGGERRRGLSQPLGGVGALCDALAERGERGRRRDPHRARRCSASWCERTARPACELESGERIAARDGDLERRSEDHVPAAARGARTSIPASCAASKHLRSRGLAAKLHLALDRLAAVQPACRPTPLRGRLLLAPSLEYLERAFNHAKYGEYSSAPAMEITVPTLNDPSAGAAPESTCCRRSCNTRPTTLTGGWQQGTTALHRALHRCRSSASRRDCASSVIGARAAHAARHRARVSHQRRPLASRRARASTSSSWCARCRAPRSTARRSPGCSCAAPAVIRAAACMGIAGRNAARQVLDEAA